MPDTPAGRLGQSHTNVDLAPARLQHRRAEDAPDVVEQGAVAVQVRARRVGPVQDGEGGIPEDAAQALLELAGGPGPAQLDHEAPGARPSRCSAPAAAGSLW